MGRRPGSLDHVLRDAGLSDLKAELEQFDMDRPITVREGDEVCTFPTIQAVMRQQARSTAKGNGPAQRHFIDRVQAIEQKELQAAAKAAETGANSDVSDRDLARALAAFIARTKHKHHRDDDSDGGKT